MENLSFVTRYPVPEEEGVHPYFYGVVGDDQLPGVLIPFIPNEETKSGIAPRKHFDGIIRTHADAPFIWTHLATTFRAYRSESHTDQGGHLIESNQRTNAYQSLFNPGAASSVVFPNFDIGIEDTSSGKIFFQADSQRTGPSNELAFGVLPSSVQKGLLPPGMIANTHNNLAPIINIDGASGHGPNQLFELSAQTELPMNGTFRVIVRPSFWNPGGVGDHSSFRVFVSLVGYKILES